MQSKTLLLSFCLVLLSACQTNEPPPFYPVENSTKVIILNENLTSEKPDVNLPAGTYRLFGYTWFGEYYKFENDGDGTAVNPKDRGFGIYVSKEEKGIKSLWSESPPISYEVVPGVRHQDNGGALVIREQIPVDLSERIKVAGSKEDE